jgi:hypothetical protein
MCHCLPAIKGNAESSIVPYTYHKGKGKIGKEKRERKELKGGGDGRGWEGMGRRMGGERGG